MSRGKIKIAAASDQGNMVYINGQHWWLGVTVQEQHLLEGGGNELQVPAGQSYFGKGSLHQIITILLICDPFWENLPIHADNFFP